jgi:hypothetical protein
MSELERPGEIDRRAFLRLASGGTVGTALAALLCRGPFGQALASVEYPQPDHQPLEGACVEAQSAEERTVAAIVDTIVPGRTSDPAGGPGALDSCALNLIYDDFFPFASNLPLILPLVDGLATDLFAKPFVDCALGERTEVLRRAEEMLPFIRLAYRFIRSTVYAGNYNYVGTTYLDWPGPNLGYVDHPDFSFGEPLSDELTLDGNLP